MKAWILYDARLGIDLPMCDSLPIYFDNEEDAKDTKDSDCQEIALLHILTDEELQAEVDKRVREREEQIAREFWNRAKERRTITNYIGVDWTNPDREIMLDQHEESFEDYKKSKGDR